MYLLIIGRSVTASRLSTSTRNEFPVIHSVPPNTQWGPPPFYHDGICGGQTSIRQSQLPLQALQSPQDDQESTEHIRLEQN